MITKRWGFSFGLVCSVLECRLESAAADLFIVWSIFSNLLHLGKKKGCPCETALKNFVFGIQLLQVGHLSCKSGVTHLDLVEIDT